ncbi:MAG: phenylalanine 4-monooxygenase [Actinomycetota bacterium]
MNVAVPVDQAYGQRRDLIAAQAAGSAADPATIQYLDSENATWRFAREALLDRWRGVAAPEILAADARLELPADRVPQLQDVSARLAPRTGYRFRAVPGLVPVDEFFGALANGVFLSTQYVRHHDSPLYTPEPDILHEVLGHATCLADPHLAALHRAAGAAMIRVETERSRQFLADVFWFSAEFGVLDAGDGNGPLAYGAGLLSSVGELDRFRDHAVVRPIDIAAMGTLEYDIDDYQPVLFAARSMKEVTDVIGEFFATATDDEIARLLAAA